MLGYDSYAWGHVGVVSGSWFRYTGIYRAWDIVTENHGIVLGLSSLLFGYTSCVPNIK